MSEVVGLVLAAGAGRRFGGPKALARADDGTPWLRTAASTLGAAGLDVLVVIPTAHPEAAGLLAPGTRSLSVDTVEEGLSGSLRAGLEAVAATDASAVLVTLVDLPGLRTAAVRRVLADDGRNSSARTMLDTALRRATYAGRPGHPVLIGRSHWPALIAQLHGDSGAGSYLREHNATPVECGDLWDGTDIDHR